MTAKTELQRALSTLVNASTCDRGTVVIVLMEVMTRHVLQAKPKDRVTPTERAAAHRAMASFLELTHEQDVSDQFRSQKLKNLLTPHNPACPAVD